MTTFIFTHNDLDGVGAAILVKRGEQEIGNVNVHISYHTYETIDLDIQNILKEGNHKNDKLIITDICPKEETCELINKNLDKFQKISLYDHHRTRSSVQKYPWATYSAEECGTSLAANLTTKTSDVLNFSFAVKAWDLWILDSQYRKRGENLNTIMGFLGIEKFAEMFFEDPSADLKKQLEFVISSINERKNRYVEKVLKDQIPTSRIYMDGLMNKFRILFATDFISEIANAALKHPACEDLNYICVINPVNDTCSLRSRQEEKVDVGAIAKEVRGGGHTTAAGFPVKMTSMIENVVFKILNSINY